jgi:cell division septation protein DedD
MSSAAHSQELDALVVAPPPDRKTRGVFLTFLSMVLVGLGLAGWYVGQRIVAAETQPSAQPAAVVQPAALILPAAVVTTSQPTPSFTTETLLPLRVEYYLQIAALGTAEDARYLKQLQSKGYQAQFDAATSHHDGRILIGPYFDDNAMERARARLVSSGILATELVR